MKPFVRIIAILFVGLISNSCERDDICSEGTQKTALLKISFQDEVSMPKTVPKLQVEIIGSNDVTFLTPEIPGDVNEISLPLDTTKDETTFYLTFNTGVVDENEEALQIKDTLTVTYEREYQYISRACGYKIIFNRLNVLETIDDETETWITGVSEENPTINNNEDIHIIIRH